MLAVSTSASEISVTTFHLTQQANLPSLSNLRWVQYDATDEGYPDAVMKAVAPDYSMDQESKSSVYKMMGTLFFWDEGCEWCRNVQTQRVQVAFNTHLVRGEASGKISIGPSPIAWSDFDKDEQHLVLLKTETKEMFDKETPLVVRAKAPLSRARMLAQISWSLDTEVGQADRTIHAQVALQDILDAKPEREFEEIHLAQFIIHVMYDCPSINLDRLRDCFVSRESAFAEAIRRLHVLGYIYYDEDGVSVHLNVEQAGKTL
ncbi:hypothetical protein BDP81DRAFT_221226 [Colletotrichum phormii]|uniref:Uncharacterized protein n=1 Tax=Colletotrichum phormii TaxID=359342 RepID=A0AAJ0EFR1_9PEZI|nr:uncharacterized protein BDP81DRAFT_221226 [Colletotrichum phormii]KAK1637254.1 hypothetical protein BDP81DRAFT_221226 [Colletotrichum phormii]